MLSKISKAFRRRQIKPDDDGGMDFDDGPIQELYSSDGRNIEALALETVISPSLTSMRGHIVYKEQMMLQPRNMGQTLAQDVKESLDRRPSSLAADAMERGDFLVLSKDAPQSPRSPNANPYNDAALASMLLPMPKRPTLKHKPVSYRTKREVPLREQTLRRNHQAAFVEQVMRQVRDETQAQALEDERLVRVFGCVSPEAWKDISDMGHWQHYEMRADGPPLVPRTTYQGPNNEPPTIFYDSRGRPFV